MKMVINNFRYNLSLENTHINFLLLRYDSIPYELLNIINYKYPNLKFTINVAINFFTEALNIPIQKKINKV